MCQVASLRKACRAPSSSLRQSGHLVNVGAGGKGALPGAGQDHRLDRVVGLVFGQCLVELARQAKTQRIELIRTVQRDHGHPVETLGQNELIGHFWHSWWGSPMV